MPSFFRFFRMAANNVSIDPEFTRICSEATLQSKKEGFFLVYAESVEDQLGEKWIHKTFSKLSTDEERISICYSDPQVREAILSTMKHVRPLYRAKDPVIAQQKLLEGHKEMSNGDNAKALILFTQALLRAMSADSEPSKTLPHAFAARSEVLFEMGKYQESIKDIQLAIREGFPENRRFQLYWRMARCHRHLGETAKARVCLQLSLKLLENASSKDQHSRIIILEEMEALQKSVTSTTQQENKEMKPGLPAVVGGENRSMPGASSYLKVAHSDNKGRYCVTRNAIAAGDCIVAEHPYASVLLPEMGGTHCHHCFQRLETAVGCPTCSGVAFCSSECRDKALTTYHQHECRYLGLMLGSGMSILCMLALRIITQEPEGLHFFCRLKPHLTTDGKGSNKKCELDSHAKEYLRVWNLETHKEERTPHDFFQRTLMAVFLLRILQDSGKFFPAKEKNAGKNEDEYSVNADEIFIGALLLHHLQLLQFNAHEIFETVVRQKGIIKGSKTVYLGVGLYPTVSFFNHDCYPALARHFVGSALILHALRPLKSGEEVPENYGPVYTKHSLEYRQRQLQCRYWFCCHCKSCSENWPDLEKLTNSKPVFRKGTGRKRDDLNNQLGTLICDLFDPALNLTEEGDVSRATQLLAEFVNSTDELGVRPPHRETQLAADALHLCLADKGNVFVLKQ
ncbi:SET and MYND domain-containing protein 4-like isoform X1 [Schistocerca americana]|uniref:SET and MYND domain-containing protein 4-like isoform X1 n=1 Tax=Schistocerca americana TaxID=7009 RepID=UPI001F4FC4D2|nr:SET and MYND domain-containing protein 4-like isoform X1 [Schistocerca americana]